MLWINQLQPSLNRSYLDLLLLQLQLLLELARTVQICSPVEVLGRLQVVKLDVSEAEVVAHKLLGSDFLWAVT